MWWSLFSIAFCLQLSTVISEDVRLELETNGPVYYKAPLAIFGRLKGAPKRDYNWIFLANLPNDVFQRRLTRGKEAMINETFNVHEDQVNVFKMAVRVTYTRFLFEETIAFGEIDFELTNKIPVTVEFKQNGTTLVPKKGVLQVSSAEIVNATVQINDPSYYFQQKGTQLTVLWGLNNEILVKYPSYARQYPSASDKTQDTLKMSLTADDANNTYIADGSVSTIIEAKNPVVELNVTGSIWIQKGNLTRLEFNCNATPPVFFCFKYSTHTINASEFNCREEDFIRRDNCHYSYVHYFGEELAYDIMVGVRNAVNDILHWDTFKRNYTIHIYNDVPARGLLRLFIVPISCVILGTIVAVSGYALYEHTKGDMRIETADFDFAGSSTREDLDASLVERTFWTHLRDELAESSPIFHWLARKPPRQATTTSNYTNEDDEPMCPPDA